MSTPDSLARVLQQHIDSPEPRHRLVLLETLGLRCLDCKRTIDLRALLAVRTSTSTSQALPAGTAPPPLRAPDRCPDHPGQTQGLCGPCRSEELAADGDVRRHWPTADVAAGAALARQSLAEAAARRRATHQTEETADA